MDGQEEKTQIITNPSGRELKEHGSYRFPFLVSRENGFPAMRQALFSGTGIRKLNLRW